jgi:hypothetical protein
MTSGPCTRPTQSSTFPKYTHSEPRFSALLNWGDTRQRPELAFILGKPSLALTETQSELP